MENKQKAISTLTFRSKSLGEIIHYVDVEGIEYYETRFPHLEVKLKIIFIKHKLNISLKITCINNNDVTINDYIELDNIEYDLGWYDDTGLYSTFINKLEEITFKGEFAIEFYTRIKCKDTNKEDDERDIDHNKLCLEEFFDYILKYVRGNHGT